MATRWTDPTIKRLLPGMHRDPESGAKIEKGGLYLGVKPTGARSWYFRFQLNGTRRKMGLGRYPAIGLSAARERARKAAALVREGVDPIEYRRAKLSQARRDASKAVTFEQVAHDLIRTKSAGWSNAKHRQQWENTLTTYAYPLLGSLPISDIDTPLVMSVLRPIWNEKPETASRVRQRIEAVLNAAKAQDLREGENPARWRGHLDNVLPKPSQVRKVRHHAALPYQQIAGFMEELRHREGVAAKALEFTILTASRVGPVFKAKWPEIDFQSNIWTCPAAHMKRKENHRVPLTDDAVTALKAMQKFRESDFIFPSVGTGKGLSNGALERVIDRMNKNQDWPDMTVHGFRSTFMDWAQDRAPFPLTIAEAALHHRVGDKVTQAYARSDAFDKRRRLMEMWAGFCSTPFSDDAAKLVVLHGERA